MENIGTVVVYTFPIYIKICCIILHTILTFFRTTIRYNFLYVLYIKYFMFALYNFFFT